MGMRYSESAGPEVAAVMAAMAAAIRATAVQEGPACNNPGKSHDSQELL